MYAITGATGNIGSKVAVALLARGERVRVIGRDIIKLQRFVDQGAEAAVGDLHDADFLTRAYKGANAVFAMIPPNHSVRFFRAYQNIVGMNISTAIREAGVQFVVNLSSQGADLPRGTGPILGLHDQEERLNWHSGVNILHLRPTFFMENLLQQIPLIHQLGFAGSAIRGDRQFAMIATQDIAGEVAEHLINRDFSGITVRDLLGPRDLSMKEAFTIIGRRIGFSNLNYVQFNYADAEKGMIAQGMGRDISRLFIEMSMALNNGLFAVNRPRLPENTTPTSIEAFAEVFAEDFNKSAPRKAA